MHFPEKLKQNGRAKKENTAIKSLNSVYARHKIKAEWADEDDFPLFNTIKADQSFNWGAYSIPFWVRFNDVCEYKPDYGIVKYSIESLRIALTRHFNNKSKYDFIEHKPIENNYSHCELDGSLKSISNKELKRQIRMEFKHNCKVICKPMEFSKGRDSFKDRIEMFRQLLISKVNFFK